jgi:alpha-galactosidase
MPPELMGSHVGTSPAHSTGRSQTMAFCAGVAMPGHFGVELDLREVTGEEREELRGAIANYKALRNQLHGTRVWTGEVGDGLQWQAHGDAGELLLFLLRIAPSTQRHQPQVRLPMVDQARRYSLSREGAEDIVLDGAWLARQGFPVPPIQGEQVLLYRITVQ